MLVLLGPSMWCLLPEDSLRERSRFRRAQRSIKDKLHACPSLCTTAVQYTYIYIYVIAGVTVEYIQHYEAYIKAF
jgi:hypothetical protein